MAIIRNDTMMRDVSRSGIITTPRPFFPRLWLLLPVAASLFDGSTRDDGDDDASLLSYEAEAALSRPGDSGPSSHDASGRCGSSSPPPAVVVPPRLIIGVVSAAARVDVHTEAEFLRLKRGSTEVASRL